MRFKIKMILMTGEEIVGCVAEDTTAEASGVESQLVVRR